MGVGNYTERDVRECARAFTGWYFDDLAFKVDPEKHDAGAKTFLGRTGDFDGVDVLEIIFEQPVTAEFFAAKIYRFLVRDELSPGAAREARHGAARRRLRGQASAHGDLHVEGLLQPGELRRAHQGPRRAHGRDDEAPWRADDARRPRFQSVDDRDGPASAESAVGRGLGRRQGVDHAGAADHARQRGARRAHSGHDGLPRLELQRGNRRRARPAACATATTSARRRRSTIPPRCRSSIA